RRHGGEGRGARGTRLGCPECCTTGPRRPPRSCHVRGEPHRGGPRPSAGRSRRDRPDRAAAPPIAPPARPVRNSPSRSTPSHAPAPPTFVPVMFYLLDADESILFTPQNPHAGSAP